MRRFVIGTLMLSGLPLTTQAQSLSAEEIRQIDQQTNISRERVPSPLPAMPNIDFRILAPEKAAVAKAVDEIEFDVKGVEIEGLTHFSKAFADALFAPLLNKKVGLSALREAASALEDKYRERGFFLVRVFIPPQQVNNGIFKVRVIEGFVSNVFVEGSNAAMNDKVKAYAQALTGLRPIDLPSLERILLMINDIPGIAGTAVLRPGATLGASELVLSVSQVKNSHVGMFSNTGSNTTGPYSMSYMGSINQPFNSLGQLSVGLTVGGNASNSYTGLASVNARYSQAVGSRGLIVSFGGSRSAARPRGYLEDLDIVSNAYSISPRMRYPLQRSRASSVYLDAGLAINRSETTALGDILTSDRSTVSDVALSWSLNGWLDGTQTMGLVVSRGLRLLGAFDKDAATPSAAGFDPEFLKYVMTFQRLQPLPNRFSARMQAIGQATQNTLLAGEQIVFGASTIGRGYTPAIIAGDRGIGAMLELRYDLPNAATERISTPQLYLSRDWAGTRSAAGDTHASLRSDAIGVRFVIDRKTTADFRLARSHQQIDTNDPNRNSKLFMEFVTQF